ncbi:DUF4349 domain-containing protein [Microbacterium fluvii]|uniref:DUF4349 domain-containing protein n=1 Tax=Microbacterium fluvii TaxID=415215 RepID=A0ABW2HAY0_9MICO|nr:DUF4349 domain-containing protein [Microbacterium fluvii]MCU4672131.1 DUF4349 domain-containing protein [Microbacterium fluvii]
MNERIAEEQPLPELSDRRVAELEMSIFRRIGSERRAAQQRRRRIWIGAGAAAGVIVIAAVIAPVLPAVMVGSSSGSSSAESAADAPVQSDQDMAGGVDETSGGSAGEEGEAAARQIIATANAAVTVADVEAAAETIADEAVDRGGYVESMSVGGSGGEAPVDADGVIVGPYPSEGGGWITVRVPADELTGALGTLSDVGEVTSSEVTRSDVTGQTVDLQARIDAAQASVDRLTVLMSQAGDLGDLIEAESALADRQANLESYQQELKLLKDQVAMSSLTVSLSPEVAVATADPAGFGDGFAAGWSGLVATLNGIVVALGFLLPWIVLAGVVLVAVWAARRGLRARRTRSRTPEDGEGGSIL